DLFFRLNVMRVRLAPLRDRRDDIPALVEHFLARYGNGHRVPDETMRALQEYDWPGNIRELEHTVQQMVAMNSGPWISTADLPTTILNGKREQTMNASQPLATVEAHAAGYPSAQPVTPLAEVE